MADLQVGNKLGVAQPGGLNNQIPITADGANTVTVGAPGLYNLQSAAVIDIIHKTTGVVLAAARTITDITSAGVVTYNGADVAAVPGTHVVVQSGGTVGAAQNNYANVNGGNGPQSPFEDASTSSIEDMRARLQLQDAAAFTTARLNSMTYNDLVYASRIYDGVPM